MTFATILLLLQAGSMPSVTHQGRAPVATIQRGVPQEGRRITGNPQRNPDGSVPRYDPRWRPPVTVIYGPIGSDVIGYPPAFNLPYPPRGLVWRRIGNDAVLYDLVGGSIVQIRSRWFG